MRRYIPVPSLLLLIVLSSLALWLAGCGYPNGSVVWLDDSGKPYQVCERVTRLRSIDQLEGRRGSQLVSLDELLCEAAK